MIYIHKVLPIFASPIFAIFAAMMLGAFLRSRFLMVFAASMLWLASTPIFANFLIDLLEEGALREQPSAVQNADAIVVLGGMTWTVRGRGKYETEWADADRFFGGLELFKAGKAPNIVFTRGKLPWESDSIPEGEFLKIHAVEYGIPESSILLTEEVNNTEAEAISTKKLFPQVDSPDIILVTSAFHMPRARIIFEAKGFNVQTYSVDSRYRVQDFTILSVLPNAYSLFRTSTAVREWIGQIYYTLKTAL